MQTLPYDIEQEVQPSSFFIKGICRYPVRNTLARERPARRDNVDCRVDTAHHGEQFKTRHAWHIEI
jgi:hypothetical protein